MESIGKRIARLRKLNQWSRAEIGRKMAQALGREKPFSGETVRAYEEKGIRPRADQRRALAAIFGISEAVLEFGEQTEIPSRKPAGEPGLTTGSDGAPRVLTAREEIVLELFSGMFSLQQRELIADMQATFMANQIMRKELGQKPLRGVSDQRIAAIFGTVPSQEKPARPISGKLRHGKGRDAGGPRGDYLEDD